MEDDIKLEHNVEPKDIYNQFQNDLLEQLPTDNPVFMAELEREGVIDEETKKKINKKRIRSVAAVILHEIERSLDDPDKKFYKLLNAMENFKNGLEILAQKIRSNLNPVGAYFICKTMENYLWMNKTSLSHLPYDKMKLDLESYGVITLEEKKRIECQHDQMGEVLDMIRSSLRSRQTTKFKRFLELMEDNDDPVLVKMAERLGGSKRVPDIDTTKVTAYKIVLMPVGESIIKCDGKNGGSYLWKGHDFRITLPPDCADGTVTITLKAYLPCSTQDHCLASAVFEIIANVTKFKKPITLSFPHWLNIKSDANTKNLRFLIFQNFSRHEVQKGSFEVGKSFGSIELSEICLISIYKQNVTVAACFYFTKAQLSTDQKTLSSAIAAADFSTQVLVNLEEAYTIEATVEATENKYVDLLILPVEGHDEKWGIYCIALDNPTYLQAIMKYFVDENQINSGIQTLKRQVVFQSPANDAIADLRIVDTQDAKIIKIIHNKKIIKQKISFLDLSVLRNLFIKVVHEINFPIWCSLHIIGKLSPSSSKLEVDGLCGVLQESAEFSLVSPTQYGYKFETYEHVAKPIIIKKPSQPEHLTVHKDRVTETTITLSWKEPKPSDVPDPSDVPLVGYEIEYGKSGEEFKKVEKSLTHEDLTCEVTGLVAHTEYYFKVAAVNEAGRGPFTVITQFTKPSQPKELHLKSTEATITLSWKESNPSDIPIDNYEVQYRKSGKDVKFEKVEKSLTCKDLSCEVTGLVPQTEYQFRVAAINPAGRGPFTDVVTQFTSFDYTGTAKELRRRLNEFKKLKYDNMKTSLYASGVITTEEQDIIDSKIGHGKMEYLIVKIIIPSLELGHGKKYKSLLIAMEDSEDTDLQDTAKYLGGSERVPADTTQTTRKRQRREESSDTESDNAESSPKTRDKRKRSTSESDVADH